METTVIFCDNRYYINDDRGKELRFAELEHVRRYLRQHNKVVGDVVTCKASQNRKCCASKI